MDLPIQTVSTAILVTEDFGVEDVADVLPGLELSPAIQAGLIRFWDPIFAAQVFQKWTPASETWIEYLGSSEDDTASLSLMLKVLSKEEIRDYISTIGSKRGVSRLAQLMRAFGAAKLLSSTPLTSETPSATSPTTDPAHVAKPPNTSPDSTDTINPSPLRKVDTLSSTSPNLPSTADRVHTAKLPTPSPECIDTVTPSPFGKAETLSRMHPDLPSTADPAHTAKPPIPSLESIDTVEPSPFGKAETLSRTHPDLPSTADPAHAAKPPTPSPKSTNISHLPPRQNIPNSSKTSPSLPSIPPHHQISTSANGIPVDRPRETTLGQPALPSNTSSPQSQPLALHQTRAHRQPTPHPSPSSDEGSLGALQKNSVEEKQMEGIHDWDPQGVDYGGSWPLGGDYLDDGEDMADGGPVAPPEKRRAADEFADEPSNSENGEDSPNGGCQDDSDDEGGGEVDIMCEDEETRPEDLLLEDEGSDEGSDEGFERSLNPWAWSQSKNDEKVQAWALEDLIQEDRLSTAAARTKWMFEARLGKMGEEAYESRREKENEAFMGIPLACRDAVGMVFYKDSKLDWEIRVFLAPAMYKYVLMKLEEENSAKIGDDAKVKKIKDERTELLDSTMEKLFDRFPDCHPNHDLRQIKKHLGSKVATRYKASFRNKFTSDAGRMRVSYLKSLGKDTPSSSKLSASTLLDILGRKRHYIAFHLWGGCIKGGKKLCEPEIEKELEAWRKKNPKAKAVEVSRRRITIVHSVRFKLFGLQDEDVKKLWSKRAQTLHIPKTPEEEQCLVDAALPYVLELLALLSERGNMHFVIFGSGKGTFNVPILMQEFSREGTNHLAFLFSDEGLGPRLKPEYVGYAMKRFDGDAREAEVGLPGVDFKIEGVEIEDTDKGPSTRGEAGKRTKSFAPQETYVAPFKPDQSSVKRVPQMAKAISEWILSSIAKVHASRPTWDKITKSPHLYIDAERMPMDPDHPNQRLQLQKPSAMSDARVRTFFKFLIESYNGDLSKDNAFCFKHESRHLHLPSPTAPDDPSIHHAAAVAAKTKVPLRKGGAAASNGRKGRQVKKLPEIPSEDEEVLDLPGLEENDAALLDDALGRDVEHFAPSRARKSHKLLIETPPDSTASTTEQVSEQLPASQVTSMQPGDSQTDAGRPRPRPMSVLKPGTDELTHPRFMPGMAKDPSAWSKMKAILCEWGTNMSYLNERSRAMPYLGIAGLREDVQLPSGLHAAFSIIQLWTAYQAPSNDSEVTINPLLGLENLQPSHHIPTLIKEISDLQRTLPSVKAVYDQLLFSEEGTCVLLFQLESAVSKYTAEVVASEQSIFEADLDLLKAFRITAFVGTAGFLPDRAKVESNTLQSTALTDRFVSALAATAFARYLKVVLTQVARLYLEDAKDEDRRSMWENLTLVWDLGCSSLARALIHRRSDIFSIERLISILPKNFAPLLEQAFLNRPWWTPGDEGAPGPLKIFNKQSVAIEPFFKMLETLPWSHLTFTERGQVMLLLFLAAIQIETGRVSSNRFAETSEPVSVRLSKALISFATVIRESDEIGPTENPIIIPSDEAASYIARWVSESQGSVDVNSRANPDTQAGGDPVSGAREEAPTQSQACVGREEVFIGTSNTKILEPLEISSITESSVVPPEEEDPTFPQATSASLHSAVDPVRTDDDPPASAIPAVRTLNEAPLPPRKKPKTSPQDPPSVGRALRSSAKTAIEVLESGSTSTADGTPIATEEVKTSGSGDLDRHQKGGPKTRSSTKQVGLVQPAQGKKAPKRSQGGRLGRKGK
ncbi:hypothetical protein FRC01_006642 [Tulasnella sp. 417]|nr:hypothetical protein FRC01_006642 [Tulasnella sp. 417]